MKRLQLLSNNTHRFVIFVTLIAATSGLLFGFDTGVIAGALRFIQHDFHPATWQLELVVSITVFGALTGALCSGRLADGFGRRHMLIATSITFIVGTLIAATAINITFLLIGRFILGLAIGVASYTAPLFISEMAPPKHRGALVLLNVVMITLGQAISFLVDYYFTASHNWRAMLATAAIPSVLLLVGLLFSPNSPRWLFLAGKKLAALKVLMQIREPDKISEESQAIERSLQAEQGGWKDIAAKKVRPVLLIAIILGIFQQLMGINTAMYYGPTIFAQVGFAGANSQILGTFGLGMVNLLATVFTVLTIDRLGRRFLLMCGTLIGAVSLACLGLLLQTPHHSGIITVLSVICLVVYISGYAISLGGLFWVVSAEIFPLNVRGLGMSIAAGMNWFANFIVASTFLTILHWMGSSATFWSYGVMSVVACIFTFYYVPETKEVSLETIELNLAAHKKTRDLGKAIESGNFTPDAV